MQKSRWIETSTRILKGDKVTDQSQHHEQKTTCVPIWKSKYNRDRRSQASDVGATEEVRVTLSRPAGIRAAAARKVPPKWSMNSLHCWSRAMVEVQARPERCGVVARRASKPGRQKGSNPRDDLSGVYRAGRLASAVDCNNHSGDRAAPQAILNWQVRHTQAWHNNVGVSTYIGPAEAVHQALGPCALGSCALLRLHERTNSSSTGRFITIRAGLISAGGGPTV